jgi:hypothetical protein
MQDTIEARQDTVSDIHYMGYMYSAKLTHGPVANGGTVVLSAPGVGANVNVDKVNWQVSTGGKVYVAPKVTVVFGANAITVTNATGASWPQHEDVTLCTKRAVLTASNQAFNEIFRLHGYAEDHETRLQTVEGSNTGELTAIVEDHERRIALLETGSPTVVPVVLGQVVHGIATPLTANATMAHCFATDKPTSWAIASQPTAGQFAINVSGALTVTAAGAAAIVAGDDLVLSVTATNAVGTSAPGSYELKFV